MRPIETYCLNIQICYDIDKAVAWMFTDVYCAKNKCGDCPFHPNRVLVRKTEACEK